MSKPSVHGHLRHMGSIAAKYLKIYYCGEGAVHGRWRSALFPYIPSQSQSILLSGEVDNTKEHQSFVRFSRSFK
jgi:hypothetical protein